MSTTTRTTISIYRNDVWAGDGKLSNGTIEDCAAILGADQDASDETYEEIEEAIRNSEAEVARPDGVYTWIIR